MKITHLFLILLFHAVKGEDGNILCSTTFCSTYLESNTCPSLPMKCSIQNSTYNGIFLPSPSPCNCCEHCIENIDEGELCATGSIGSPIPTSLCGPGLTCVSGKCARMTNSACIKEQDAYDQKRKDGTLGSLEVRPQCDGSGDYQSYKCVPGQTCFCLDKSGNRIFGEIDYTDSAPYLLQCGCSRKYYEAVNLLGRDLHPHEHFRCRDKGDYDSVQCIGDQCLCVDSQDGAPTYPYEQSVNITLISNKTLPCYDEKIHKADGYYYKCAKEYLTILQEMQDFEDNGYDLVFDYTFPSCSLSGKYGPVQKTATTLYCSDADGNKLENYEIAKNDLAASAMDCKCAQTRHIMSSEEKPECCPNGNFKKLQCRRGSCRCVDRDGYQIEKEVPQDQMDKLSCYADPCDFQPVQIFGWNNAQLPVIVN